MKKENPTIEDLAHMSLVAYQEGTRMPPPGWSQIGNSHDFNKNRLNGHYAILYKSESTNTYVIAHRGTRINPEGVIIDFLINDSTILGLGMCWSANNALDYFTYVYENLKLETDNNFKLYVTGHSKGAFEAAHIVKKLKTINSNNEKYMTNFIGGLDLTALVLV